MKSFILTNLTTILRTLLERHGIAGTLKILASKISGNPPTVRLKYKANFYIRHEGAPWSDFAMFRQVFIEKQYEFEWPNDVTTIVDAGANIGCSAVYFAERYPAANVYLIEPSKSNFRLLLKNTESFSNIVAIHAAVWSSAGTMAIQDRGEGTCSFYVEKIDFPLPDVELVDAVTFGGLIMQYDLGMIDILKIDIEGAEKEIFDERSDFLDIVNVLIIETHDRWIAGCTEAVIRAASAFPYCWIHGENIVFCREGWLPKGVEPVAKDEIALSR